jgi:hypothetical protein
MRLLDACFAQYHWYRRWCGGQWYCRYLDYPVCTYVWRRRPIHDALARGATMREDYT